jgi:mono/diheme cytochrome c family protein
MHSDSTCNLFDPPIENRKSKIENPSKTSFFKAFQSISKTKITTRKHAPVRLSPTQSNPVKPNPTIPPQSDFTAVKKRSSFWLFLTTTFLLLPLAVQGSTVTFNKDIAPIIYHNCSPCHRPGEAAPFTLLSYDDVAKKSATIAKATSKRLMPPWKAQPASFPYRDERRLTDQQIALIQDWVKAGKPEGNPADKPDAPKFASGWQLGDPDLIVEMPAAYHVPADGPDIYRNIAVPIGLTEDKWLTAIVMKPSARAVVHHVLYFTDPNGRIHERPQQGSEPGFSGMRVGNGAVGIGGWAVGGQPHFYPAALGLQIRKGSDLVVQYHFHPTGKPEAEKSLIGLYFAKKAPERTLTKIQMPPHYSLFSGLDIPAGEKDFIIRDSFTLPAAVDGVGVSSHAHYIATQLKMTATLPDGDVKTLLFINDWDFAWQDVYYFKDFVALPKGTRLDAEIHWDNSVENPHNPSSPPIRVTWGEESKDEMGSISLLGVAHDEAELPTLKRDVNLHQREIVRSRLASDPALGKRIKEMLGE